MMVFCCGCTLQFATQFLLWTELAIDSIWFLYSITAFIFYIRNIEDPYFEYYYGYYILWSVTGILTTILGLFGIKKKKPLLLNGFLYYLHYYLCFEVCSMVILIIWPTFYNNIFNHTFRKVCFVIYMDTSLVRDRILSAVWYLFVIANLIYFVVVVKVYRDDMLENKTFDDTAEMEKLATCHLNLKTVMRKERTLTL